MDMTGGAVMEVVADGHPGGGTTAVLGLCEDLKHRLGREIVLVTQKDSYAFRRGEALGLNVLGFDFFRSRFDLGLKAALNNLMQSAKPALVHAHGGRAAHALIGGKRDFPLVYTVHGYHFPGKPSVVRPFFRLAEARIVRDVDHIVFVSKSDRHLAEKYRLIPSRAAFSVIGNGIDSRQLGANSDAERGNIIVFLSRLHRQKNPLLAVEMMQHLRDLSIQLVMIGGGDLERQVLDRVARLDLGASVQVLGALPREQALTYLRRAKLMVFPSLWEGLPIAPMEALYFGVPVVASDIPGTDEVVVDDRNGVLVKNPGAETMAAAVRSLLGNPQRWERLSAAGRKDAAEKFNRDLNSSAHIELYRSLIRAE
jgi:glycosyltransferase involved in cell wall biosynthesis